jgi:hypothetical protein
MKEEPKTIDQLKFIEGFVGSQREAARLAGVQPNTWWRWISGRIDVEGKRTSGTRELIRRLYYECLEKEQLRKEGIYIAH